MDDKVLEWTGPLLSVIGLLTLLASVYNYKSVFLADLVGAVPDVIMGVLLVAFPLAGLVMGVVLYRRKGRGIVSIVSFAFYVVVGVVLFFL